jgi:hypothetical protein
MSRRRHILGCLLCFTLMAALEESGRGWTEATTSATAAQSKLEIRGVSGQARHLHAGAPAQLGHARFVFINHDEKSHRVSVTDIEFLHGIKSCEQPPSKVVSHLKSGGILLLDGKQRESAPRVEVPAGATVEATVGFTSVPAYYVYCDRFAFRVHFQVDAEKIAVMSEVNITWVEPLRPRGE